MKLKAFQVDDSTWYAAETAEQAAQIYEEDVGDPCEDGYPTEVSDAMLDAKIPEMDENERITDRITSMRVFLDEMTAPGFLASSDY